MRGLMKRYDLVCIGCGPAGEKAAIQAAAAGRRVAIVERSGRPGGAMVNTGTIPSKALRETALLCSAFRRRPLPGMDLALDRSLSVPRFMAQRHLIEQQEHDHIEAELDRFGIEIVQGSARIVGPNEVAVTGHDGTMLALAAEYILVATGSSPVRPAHVPFDRPCVVDADGILELEHLPESLVIVGGGVIGCEYASIFAEMGVRTTLVHGGPAVLPFLDDECRAHLEEMMRENGVDVRAGVSVQAVLARADGVHVVDDRGREIQGEILLWAAGRSSNVEGLGLEEVGVALGNRGLVLVDDDYRTNVPSIFAAGDVIGFPALASTSKQQGRVAASAMFDLDFRGDRRSIPIGLYTIPGVSSVGLTEAQALAEGLDAVPGRTLFRDNVRGRMLGDERGILKCVFERSTRRLLGATIVGEQATELIHLAQAILEREDAIGYFVDACFNYPSLAELYRSAAFDALRAMNETDAERRRAA